MAEKLDETLKRVADNMPTGKQTEPAKGVPEPLPEPLPPRDLPGKPDCPVCGGVGYYRQDVDVTHPDFGKLTVCTCRKGDIDAARHQRLYAMSKLDELRHLTFETFKVGGRGKLRPKEIQSLEIAYESAQHFSRTHDGWLLLIGRYGCGKTHLAAAIANSAVELGIPTLFLTVPDLLDTLRFSYDDPEATFESRFEEIRNAPLLVMDDFGTENATDWAVEKLFQILNYRYINKLPLVMTTNLLVEELEQRIRSRLEDPELVRKIRILAPDFRRPSYDTFGFSRLSVSAGNIHRKTFAAFDLREKEKISSSELASLKKAFEESLGFAEDPDGWLVLTGPFGSGKTHLAAAIANYQADLGNLPMFVVVPDLFDHLRKTFSPKSTVSLDRLFEEVKNSDLLILDDLGTQNMTNWVREKLYQLINYRYNSELPTVITTPDFKDEMDSRIRSRMEDRRLSIISAITAPSYRGTERTKRRRKKRR